MKHQPLIQSFRARILLLGGLVAISALSTSAGEDADATTRRREEFLDWKFGMFIHYNIATYHDRQWATGREDPATFKPDKLDCNQWIESAAAAGMKYAVLTVKHTGGYCLWDSKHTASQDITAFVNYKDGKGDIHSYEYPLLKATRAKNHHLPPEDNKHPAEVCDKLGPGWFWSTNDNESLLTSAADVAAMVRLCNNRRANYLLNVAPDRSGLIPAYAVECLRQIGRLLDEKEK